MLGARAGLVDPEIAHAIDSLPNKVNELVLTLAGYNPMSQFVHESDLAAAVIHAWRGIANGVYNVAGPAVIPWRTALELAGARSLSLPSTLVKAYVRLFSAFPEYLVNFLKYPCVITDALFRKDFGWQPKIDIRATIASAVNG